MKTKFMLLLMYINRFGFFKGLDIFYQNTVLTRDNASFVIPGLARHSFLRRSTSDIQAFHQVFLDLTYKAEINFAPQFIIDGGANIGMATLYYKREYPTAQIVSVEAESKNFEMLVKNTKGYSEIDCINMGLWNKNAILKVEDTLKIGNWGFVCREVEQADDTTINAISIEEIMRRHNRTEIDILKIDIESSELELFSSNYENWLPKTRVVIIELHDWMKKGCSRAFFTALFKYDFTIYYSGDIVLCIRN